MKNVRVELRKFKRLSLETSSQMEKWWQQQSWEMRESQAYQKQVKPPNSQEKTEQENGRMFLVKVCTFPMLLNQRAFRNPLHHLVTISPLELTKGSHAAKQQARKLHQQLCKGLQTTNKPGTKASLLGKNCKKIQGRNSV